LTVSFFINSILLGVGLAMDAFSVSMANGLNDPKMKAPRMNLIAGMFGAFQYIMPMAGWICIHTMLEKFQVMEKFIPWIALILLAFIGGKMLIEGIKGGEEEEVSTGLSFKLLLVQAVATSIDALSVGFTIAEYDAVSANISALIIGIVTYAISMAGIFIGKKFGDKLAGKANILGGVILIAIGIEIFIKGVF